MTCVVSQINAADDQAESAYHELVQLFDDWREFERPPVLDGEPDYSAERFFAAYDELQSYVARLEDIDTKDWSLEQKADWHIVRAEMNGFDFNHRVLKPWARDPAYYQSIWTAKSDVPAHEGPPIMLCLSFGLTVFHCPLWKSNA